MNRLTAVCFVMRLACAAPLCAQTTVESTVRIHAEKQASQETRSNTLHLFGGRKTELTMQFSGMCGPAHGRRVTLLQVAGKLALPLGTVHEDTNAASEQSLHVPLTVPEVTQPADFQLAVSVRHSKDGAWTLLDTVDLKVYPANFFAAVAKGYSKLFDFALLDPAGQLHQLFAEAGIPFTDLSDGKSLPQPSVPDKAVLALCVLPVQHEAVERDIAAVKEAADNVLVFKERTDELAMIHIHEKEPLYQVQADLSLLDDLPVNPKSQNNVLSLIDLVFNHLHEKKGAER